MLHLLKIEWLKIKNYRTFWVIFLLFLVSIVGVNYIVYSFQQFVFGQEAKRDAASAALKFFLGNPPYAFPQVWQMASQATSYILIILGLLVVILFTNEFSYKTHRQNLIDGQTRFQFITSKVLLIIVFSLITTIMVGLTSLLFGFSGDKPFSTDKIYYLALTFLQCLNYCLFALLCSVFFKRSGISIGFYFIYVVIIELALFFLFKFYFKVNYGYFLPVESADGLISAPVFENIRNQWFKQPAFQYQLSACIAYVVLFLILSYRKFQKDNL